MSVQQQPLIFWRLSSKATDPIGHEIVQIPNKALQSSKAFNLFISKIMKRKDFHGWYMISVDIIKEIQQRLAKLEYLENL